MSTTVTTNTGKSIEADLVVRGQQYAVLHIYTHTITPVEAYQIFGDPQETIVLTVTTTTANEEHPDEDPLITTQYYRGFTEVYSVQKGILITGPDEILIWMQRPEIENKEE